MSLTHIEVHGLTLGIHFIIMNKFWNCDSLTNRMQMYKTQRMWKRRYVKQKASNEINDFIVLCVAQNGKVDIDV